MPLQRPKRARTRATPAAVPPRDPRVMSDAELEALGDLETAVLSYDDGLRYMRRQKLVCRGPIHPNARETAVKLLAAGQRDDATKYEAGMRGVRNRSTQELEPCGYDFVDMIEATKHPLDGSLMAYQCPKCGVQGEMRVAFLNIADRPETKAHQRAHERFLAEALATARARVPRSTR